MAVDSSLTGSEGSRLPRDAARPPRGGIVGRIVVLAALLAAAWTLPDADLADSPDAWVLLVGAAWVAILAMKGSGRG